MDTHSQKKRLSGRFVASALRMNIWGTSTSFLTAGDKFEFTIAVNIMQQCISARKYFIKQLSSLSILTGGHMKHAPILLVSAMLASPVVAADSNSPTEQPTAPAITSDWNGAYFGLGAGMSQTISRDVTTTETLGTKFLNRNSYGSFSSGSGFGGVQAGYNWQRNNLVWGIEGDIQSGVSDSTSGRAHIGGGTLYDLSTSSKIKWFGTARLRTGYAFNKSLVYATGGLAIGDTEYTQNFSDNVDYSANFTKSKTRVGYVLGAGIEHAMSKTSSIKLEYQYLDLGRVNLHVPESGPVNGYALHTRLRANFQTIRVGVNWKY